jgi:hypothetical protein
MILKNELVQPGCREAHLVFPRKWKCRVPHILRRQRHHLPISGSSSRGYWDPGSCTCRLYSQRATFIHAQNHCRYPPVPVPNFGKFGHLAPFLLLLYNSVFDPHAFYANLDLIQWGVLCGSIVDPDPGFSKTRLWHIHLTVKTYSTFVLIVQDETIVGFILEKNTLKFTSVFFVKLLYHLDPDSMYTVYIGICWDIWRHVILKSHSFIGTVICLGRSNALLQNHSKYHFRFKCPQRLFYTVHPTLSAFLIIFLLLFSPASACPKVKKCHNYSPWFFWIL